MKQIIHNYSSSALVTSKQITLTDFTASQPVYVDRLLLIVDAVTNKIIYNFADPTVTTATISSNNIITLGALQGSETNGDKLLIFYDTLIGDPNYDPELNYISVAGFPNMLHHVSAEGKLAGFTPTTVSPLAGPGGAINQIVEVCIYSDGGAEMVCTLDGSDPAIVQAYPLTVASVTLTSGSPTATVVSGGFASVGQGMFVLATGMPSGTYVSAYTYGSNSLTLSQNYTGTTGTYTLTFHSNFLEVFPSGTPSKVVFPVNAVPTVKLASPGTPQWRVVYRGS